MNNYNFIQPFAPALPVEPRREQLHGPQRTMLHDHENKVRLLEGNLHSAHKMNLDLQVKIYDQERENHNLRNAVIVMRNNMHEKDEENRLLVRDNAVLKIDLRVSKNENEDLKDKMEKKDMELQFLKEENARFNMELQFIKEENARFREHFFARPSSSSVPPRSLPQPHEQTNSPDSLSGMDVMGAVPEAVYEEIVETMGEEVMYEEEIIEKVMEDPMEEAMMEEEHMVEGPMGGEPLDEQAMEEHEEEKEEKNQKEEEPEEENEVIIERMVILPPVHTRSNDFNEGAQYWRQQYEGKVLPDVDEELNLNVYLFNPDGQRRIPQTIKNSVNQCSFYQNQRPVALNNPKWRDLSPEEKESWKDIWTKMRKVQVAQRSDGLIGFEERIPPPPEFHVKPEPVDYE